MITDRDLIKHAVSETVRAWREGGTAHIALPHPETGELVEGMIDQRGAAELIAWYLDRRRAEAQQQLSEGAPLSREDRRILTMFQKAACSFVWITTPDGRHCVLPRNAHFAHLTEPPEWLELAGHPSSFDLDWYVPEPMQVPDAAPGVVSATITVNGDTLTTWTRLEHLNDDKWDERRRLGIPAPPSIDDQLTFWRRLSAHKGRRRRPH